MKYKKILVKNPNPKKGNGEYVFFENAKCDRNKVDLRSYNNVFLSLSAN